MDSAVLIAATLTLLGFELVYHSWGLKTALPIFDGTPPLAVEKYAPDPTAESATFPTPDGLILHAAVFRTPRRTPRGLILFCPEIDSSRWSAAYYCEGLLAAGFHILSFDFRNQGDSERMPGYDPNHWLTAFEALDVMAAVAFIDSREDLRGLPLGVFGVSRGGGAALIAAAECPRIRCAVTDGAYSLYELLLHFCRKWARLYFPEIMLRLLPLWHWQLNMLLIRWVSQWRRRCRYVSVERALSQLGNKPVYMVSGERDNYVIPEITNTLHARTGQDDSQVWIVPGAKHNLARQTETSNYDRWLVESFAGLESTGSIPLRPGGAPDIVMRKRFAVRTVPTTNR